MFASVRTYQNAKSPEEVGRRATTEFLPMLKQMPGFRGYYLIDGGGGTIVSVTLFDDRASAESSADKARQWVTTALRDLASPEPPTIVSGRLIASSST